MIKQIAKVGDIVLTKWDNGPDIKGIISGIHGDEDEDGEIIGIPQWYSIIYKDVRFNQSVDHEQILEIKGNIFDFIS